MNKRLLGSSGLYRVYVNGQDINNEKLVPILEAYLIFNAKANMWEVKNDSIIGLWQTSQMLFLGSSLCTATRGFHHLLISFSLHNSCCARPITTVSFAGITEWQTERILHGAA